jgi:hypothetical protein
MMNLKAGKSGGQERRDGMACWAGMQIRRADNVNLDQVQLEVGLVTVLGYDVTLCDIVHQYAKLPPTRSKFGNLVGQPPPQPNLKFRDIR